MYESDNNGDRRSLLCHYHWNKRIISKIEKREKLHGNFITNVIAIQVQ